MFQGVIDRGIWSREDFTTVFGEKGKVERVEVFESKSSLFCREMKEFPVDPVNFRIAISFPEKVGEKFINAVEDVDGKFVDCHRVDKNGL